MAQANDKPSKKSTAKDISIIGVVGSMLLAYLNSNLSPWDKETSDILILGVPLVAALVGKTFDIVVSFFNEITAKALLWNAKRKTLKTIKDPNVSPETKKEAQELYDRYALLECAPRVVLTT